MRYIFFLGKNPALSLAELSAMLHKFRLDHQIVTARPAFVVVDIERDFPLRDFFVQMGGIIKVGKLAGQIKNLEELGEFLRNFAMSELASPGGKKSLGFSLYFSEKTPEAKEKAKLTEVRRILYELKNTLGATVKLRIVEPSESKLALSSASVFQNRLAASKKGVEFNLIFTGGGINLFTTLIVQDIESYSLRDYGKPGRDAHIGMMPPKLAQAMINLAQISAGDTLCDPFCGTGTILQEALLNDYKVIGSDNNGEQIAKTKQNLAWLARQYDLTYPNYKVFQGSFTDAFRRLKPDSVDAIVTEGTLGPTYRKLPDPAQVRNNYLVLRKLYSRFLTSARNPLKPAARIVLSLPAYQIRPGEFVLAEFVDSLQKLGYDVMCPLKKAWQTSEVKITKRNTIIYARPEQIVAREIVIFQKTRQ